MSSVVRRPKLYILNVRDFNESVDTLALPEDHALFDYVCLRVSNYHHVFSRIDLLADVSDRCFDFKLSLADTLPLSDVFEHFKDVFAQLPALGHGKTWIDIKMRPTDPTIERVYGTLEPHWYAVKLRVKAKHLATPSRWGAQVKLARHDERAYGLIRCLREEGDDVDWIEGRPVLRNLYNLRCCEFKDHQQPLRTILVVEPRTPEHQPSIVNLTIASMSAKGESTASNIVPFDANSTEDIWWLYELREDAALFVSKQITEWAKKDRLLPFTFELSKRNYMHRLDPWPENHVVPVQKYVFNSRVHLEYQCRAAALAFCQTNLPLYTVLWIVQWLPAMYRLKDHEIVRLLEVIYGSAKRIRERRAEKGNHIKID